jgi:hypothetical protein
MNSQLVWPANFDNMLWLGDFNQHYPMWEDEANKHLFEPEEFISPFIDLHYKNNMLLALCKGIPTYQTTVSNWTGLDGVWHSNTPDNPIICCDVVLWISNICHYVFSNIFSNYLQVGILSTIFLLKVYLDFPHCYLLSITRFHK